MRLDIRRRFAVVLVVLSVLAMFAIVPVAGQDASPIPEPTPAPNATAAATTPADECIEPEPTLEPLADETLSMPEDYRIALFEGVWEGIRDYYVDPDTNGLDWEAIGDEYAPLILATDNAYEVYELLAEMVALLEDPFTGFFAPEDIGDPETYDPSYGGIGALIDDRASEEDGQGLLIAYVFEGGSASDAGIGPRDRVIGVNGDPCVRIADIRGPEGTEVTLTVVSPGEEPRDLALERRRIDPVILPEARRLEQAPDIGYLRVIALSGEEAVDGIEQALTRFVRNDPIEGLVIDLRGSNQGAPGVILEFLRTFVTGQVGEFHSRVGNEPIEIEPNDLADRYADIPVVVLVDEYSEAEAEQFAAIMQDQGRATIVGTQTSGQTHGANTLDFVDGSVLQIVSFGFQLPDGQTMEGQGVTPDVEVDADWMAYPESEDPGILAALEVIGSTAGSGAVTGPVPGTASPEPEAAPSEAPAG